MTAQAPAPLKHKDFASDQDVRWCPGCGDYVVLSAVHKAMAALGRPPHEVVVISGIGCSSRFPYYMSSYGFHTIHGRAPTIASGVKVANPDLAVWLITGDGDGLSIGGNHLLHILRRNIDVNILLFNNRVYGLTKGQYSPCSDQGMVTKTSPMGAIEQPINPLSFALASQATFVARTYDTNPKHMAAMFERAAQHKGVSFVEIFQNCIIFNNGVHDNIVNRKVRSDRLVELEHGKPLVFGALGNKGLRVEHFEPEVVEFDPEAGPPDGLLVHDEQGSTGLHFLLTRLKYPDHPVPMGVFRQIAAPTYEEQLHDQVAQAQAAEPPGDLQTLFRRHAETWVIDGPADGRRMTGRIERIDQRLDDGGPEKDSYVADLASDAAEHQGVDKLLREARLSAVQPHSETLLVPPSTTIAAAVELIRAGATLGTLLVTGDAGRIAGIVTERDLLARLAPGADPTTMTVDQIMTPDPACLTADDSVAAAINFMAARGYRRVPIIGGGQITVLTIDDVLDFIRDA